MPAELERPLLRSMEEPLYNLLGSNSTRPATDLIARHLTFPPPAALVDAAPPCYPRGRHKSPKLRERTEKHGRRQFIYHMRGLNKTWPGGKKVLENINLSFYPDAKIGVLGVNGSGKSTLLRIMAGSTLNSSAKASSPKGRGSATYRRSRSSTQISTCAATSCSASRTSRRSSTATTNWR